MRPPGSLEGARTSPQLVDSSSKQPTTCRAHAICPVRGLSQRGTQPLARGHPPAPSRHRPVSVTTAPMHLYGADTGSEGQKVLRAHTYRAQTARSGGHPGETPQNPVSPRFPPHPLPAPIPRPKGSLRSQEDRGARHRPVTTEHPPRDRNDTAPDTGRCGGSTTAPGVPRPASRLTGLSGTTIRERPVRPHRCILDFTPAPAYRRPHPRPCRRRLPAPVHSRP